MNIKQLAYQYGRLKWNNPHIFYPTLTAAPIVGLSDVITGYLEEGVTAKVIGLPIYAYFAFEWGKMSIVGVLAKKKLNKIKEEKCSIDRIVLSDKQGLDKLLERTAENQRIEWGTVLKSSIDGREATIYEIMDPDLAEEKKMVKPLSRGYMTFDDKMMEREGYTSTHHFHPNRLKSWGGMNFAVNLLDKTGKFNQTELLTFNLPEGPEIIGYNSWHTYIPSDKSKSELVKATPKQIMEYLS